MKAEILPKGPNTRVVVTTWIDPPEAVYEWDHRPRGERKLEQGPQKRLLGRLAQLPPLLGQPISLAAACRRFLAARRAPAVVAPVASHLTLVTLRLRLMTIGGWVRQRLDRVQ